MSNCPPFSGRRRYNGQVAAWFRDLRPKALSDTKRQGLSLEKVRGAAGHDSVSSAEAYIRGFDVEEANLALTRPKDKKVGWLESPARRVAAFGIVDRPESTRSSHTHWSKADGQNRLRRMMFCPASLWSNSPAVARRVLDDAGFQPQPRTRCDAPGLCGRKDHLHRHWNPRGRDVPHWAWPPSTACMSRA